VGRGGRWRRGEHLHARGAGRGAHAPVMGGHGRSSEVMGGHPSLSAFIRGHQWSSVAIITPSASREICISRGAPPYTQADSMPKG